MPGRRRGLDVDRRAALVDPDDPPPPAREDQVRVDGQRERHRQRAEQLTSGHEPVLGGGRERDVEREVVDEPLSGTTQDERSVARLRDEVMRRERPQERSQLGRGQPRERPRHAQRPPHLLRLRAAVLGDQRERLLDERRQVQRLRLGRLAPVLEQERDRRDRLDELRPEPVLEGARGGELGLGDVQPEDRRIARRAPAAPEALAQRGDRVRGADLPDAHDAADVDAELQRRRADRRDRALPVLEHPLDVVPQLPRQRSMVREELVRDALGVAAPAEEVGEGLDVGPAVGEDEVVRAAQGSEQVVRDGGQRAGVPRHVALQLEPELAAVVARLDAPDRRPVAGPQELAGPVEIAERGAQREPRDPAADDQLEAVQQALQLGAALRADERVQLVDDDVREAGEHVAQSGPAEDEQRLERLRRDEQDSLGPFEKRASCAPTTRRRATA